MIQLMGMGQRLKNLARSMDRLEGAGRKLSKSIRVKAQKPIV
jgi:hypothetical protein